MNRRPEHRKSIVELEIERQKEREEEARKEAEFARRIQDKIQGDGKGLDKKSDEIKPKEHRPRQTSETNGLAVKAPSVHKKTEKFEKKSEEYKAKDHGHKKTSDTSGKNPGIQKQIEIETVVEPEKTTAVSSPPPVDEIDVMQRTESGEDTQAEAAETEEERKRREEKEIFKQMQEEERRRREAQRQDLERIRKEVDRKEAEELLRVKLAKEEEKKKQREAERKLAEERAKDNTEKLQKEEHAANSRKTAFAAHKLILEHRVLKALEESKQESTLPKRRASSFDRPTEAFGQDDSVSSEASEEFSSGGVKLRKGNFEKPGARKDSKEELRKKRYSLNLDPSLRNKHPGSMKDHVPSYTADDAFVKGSQAQEDVTRRGGGQAQWNESKLTKAKSVGDLNSHPVFRKVSFNQDQTDSVDGLPAFSDSKIQRELEEQRRREEIVKQETLEREKRHRLEEEKKKTTEPSVGKKEMSLNDIKRNPLPNKIQVSKPDYNISNLLNE